MTPFDGSHDAGIEAGENRGSALPSAATGRPNHYKSLAAVKSEAFALLSRGVADRRSGFHTPVLVTNGLDAFPAARIVVLRGFDPDFHSLAFHSDYRAGKVAEIMENDRAAAVFYDARKKIQMRVTGQCHMHHQDAIAGEAWKRLNTFSRRYYLAETPGSISENPSSGLSPEFEKQAPSENESDKGLANFVVIRMQMVALEWLYLSAHGHRREKFEWLQTGDERGCWLTP